MQNAKFDGQKVKQLRLESNLTQKELADMIGTSQEQISRFEKGQEPQYQTLKKLAQALEVSSNDLYYSTSRF